MAEKNPKKQNTGKEAHVEVSVTEEPLPAGKDSLIPESSMDESAPIHEDDAISVDTFESPSEPLPSVKLGANPVSKAPSSELPVQDGGGSPAPEVSLEESEQSPAPAGPEVQSADVFSDALAQSAPPKNRLVDWEKDEAQSKAPKAKRSKQPDTLSQEGEQGQKSDMSPAQKAAETRRARKGVVIDFLEGKRTSPFADGKPITPEAAEEPSSPVQPPEPKEAPRPGEQEQIVYLNLSELHAFKNHPFQVRNDDEMRAMVESVKDKGVTQPAIVRPREDGGYEIVSGHRRQKASELAGYADMPCIIRSLTDEQAITQIVEDNTNQRENILTSERAKALKMQLDAIKKQGARTGNGQRSNEIVAERNKMTVKQVQRYIKLNDLVPDLMKMVDDKKISFTPAVELAFIRPRNQRYIAIAIEGQQSAPSLSQAQRMRELDQKGSLNGDVIDGIMLEEKKEVDKVIISSQELAQYFGKEKTPREMKDTIIQLLDEWKAQQPELATPEKQAEQEK